MFIGIIDWYHFIPLSLTLTLPRGHKISAKQIYWFNFQAYFSSDQNRLWCGDEVILAEQPEYGHGGLYV